MNWNTRRQPENIPDISEIYALLLRLGLTPNYTGFFHIAYAVHLAVQRPERLRMVTKWLYPEVAKNYKTTWKCVERNIRTAAAIVWEAEPEQLAALAGHPLSRKPTVSEFLSLLAMHFLLDAEE